MQISAQLDQLRKTFSGCQAIAYADLRTQMILAMSTADDIPQERWEYLCDTGVALLTGDPARQASNAMLNGNSITHALIVEQDELGLFVRSNAILDDAILCVAHPTLQVLDFVAHAQDVLGRMADDD